MRIRRYTQSHTIDDPRIARAVATRSPQIEPYDRVAELWWDTIEDIARAGSTPQGRGASRELLTDERNLIDFVRSPTFYAEEHIIIGD